MIFITYPRSGVNFLSNAIALKTIVRIKYSHEEYTDDNVILNIVRDPVESFTSCAAMNDFNKDINAEINVYAKNKYINMYKFLLSKDTIFINYKDLSQIDNLVEKISEILKLRCDLKPLNVDLAKLVYEPEQYPGWYYSTSKKNPKYKEYNKIIKSLDLSECYDLYYKALNRCIKI